MLGWFASDFFSQSPVLVFPLIALAIFFSVFLIVSLRALFLRPEARDRLASLPLEQDTDARPGS